MGEWIQWLQNSTEVLQSLPWLLLFLFLAPLGALAFWRRIYPHTPLGIALLLPSLLTIGVVFNAELFLLVVTLDIVIAMVAVFDMFSLPGAGSFSASRQMLQIASLRIGHPVTLTVSNHSRRNCQVWIRDDVPQPFDAEPDEFVRRLPPRSRTTLHYELKAKRRGSYLLENVYVRVRSVLGFWQRFEKCAVSSVINVYPDMQQLSEYAVLARTNRLSLMGLRRTRRIGQDHDFERLRDYSLDDNYKHIDWRSTARRNKLTVKDFQTSQSQRVMFLVDCGRMMTSEAAGLSLLDHAFNAMLMLSYVALRRGDSVGLICFSNRIHTYIPPHGGMSQMNRLLHASFDRFPELVESRYDQAFLHLSSYCRKRSLVVLMTNLIDEVNSHQIERYLSTLVGKHLPLGVLLRDHQLFDAADQSPRDERELYTAAAAAEILTWRHQVLTDLEHRGVLSLDVFPEDMTAPLVNRYLEIKARHLL